MHTHLIALANGSVDPCAAAGVAALALGAADALGGGCALTVDAADALGGGFALAADAADALGGGFALAADALAFAAAAPRILAIGI